MKRLLATTLLAATCAFGLPAQAFDLNSMSEEDRNTFREEIRAYLLENPEVIMEAVQVLEQRQIAQQAEAEAAFMQANAQAIYDDGVSYVGGNLNGDITLVEFLDYRCGYCKRAHPEIDELIASDGNIKLIVKEFPILGEQSTLASKFAIAVRQIEGPETYKQVADFLMGFRGNVTEETLERVSDDMGLDTDAILTRMDSEDVNAEIAANHALAQRLQISGTPSFILDGEMIRGYVPLDTMQQYVAAAREG